jgi:hypothetical protein
VEGEIKSSKPGEEEELQERMLMSNENGSTLWVNIGLDTFE